MSYADNRATHYGEIKREVQEIDRNLFLLADKESSAKQRRSLRKVSAVINQAIKYIGRMMAIAKE